MGQRISELSTEERRVIIEFCEPGRYLQLSEMNAETEPVEYGYLSALKICKSKICPSDIARIDKSEKMATGILDLLLGEKNVF